MVLEVIIRPAAERDLAALYAYIRDARGDPMVAMRYLQRIRLFCEGLAIAPLRGRQRDDICIGLRIASFERRVIVAYIVNDESVLIGRVFYGGRDYEALLSADTGELP